MPTGNPTSKGEKCTCNRGILDPQITAKSSTDTFLKNLYFSKQLYIKSSNRILEGLKLLRLCSTEDCEHLLLPLYQEHSHES